MEQTFMRVRWAISSQFLTKIQRTMVAALAGGAGADGTIEARPA